MINIISTFYISKYSSNLDQERSKELESALLNNLANEYVEKVHLFVDDIESLNRLIQITDNTKKICIIDIGIKPKYNDFFKYILTNVKDKICMIANSDIYLHQLDLKLIERLATEKMCYALSRYEHDMSCPQINNYGGSHDCYIFNSKFIDDSIINNHTDFYQNLPGIETQIIKNFSDFNFKVFNPCKQIITVHLHKTQLRNHGQWIGLHNCGDWDYFKKSVWYIIPIVL
jgi:hypothetical protein